MKLKTALIFFSLLFTSQVLAKQFPYQRPHRFGSPWKWVRSDYLFAGDFEIYSKDNSLNYQTASSLIAPRPTTFMANKKYSIIDDFFSRGLKPCNDSRLPQQFNVGTTIIFTPNNPKYPTAAVTRIVDAIVVYVGHPEKSTNGSTLIFNIDSFEKYITATNWYDGIEYQLGGKARIDKRISFGFAFNADKADFTMLTDDSFLPNAFTANALEMQWYLGSGCGGKTPNYVDKIVPLSTMYRNDFYKTNNIKWGKEIISLMPIISSSLMDDKTFGFFKSLINNGNKN